MRTLNLSEELDRKFLDFLVDSSQEDVILKVGSSVVKLTNSQSNEAQQLELQLKDKAIEKHSRRRLNIKNRETVCLLAKAGKTTEEIARSVGVSTGTIIDYRKAITWKTCIHRSKYFDGNQF